MGRGGRGGAGATKRKNISVIVSKKKKQKKTELTGLRTAGERCRSWNARLDFSPPQQCDGKNRKRRVCERLDGGKDRVCAQFGETDKKRGGGVKKNLCMFGELGGGGVGQTARNWGVGGGQGSRSECRDKKESEETPAQPAQGWRGEWMCLGGKAAGGCRRLLLCTSAGRNMALF